MNPSRPRLLLAISLTTIALALVAVGTFGYRNPYDLVLATRWLDHVFIYGVVASLMLGLGLAMMLPKVPWVVIATPVVLVALSWASAGSLSSISSPEDESIVRAPVSAGRDYEAVVRFVYSGVIDPAWTISVRQRSGLLAREWEACYIEENPQFKYVRWDSRTRLVVSTSAGDFTIRVRGRDGRPDVVRGGEICR